MARVSKGNSLSTPVLQPGWTIENDGFGLLTCSATFKANHGTSGGSPGTGVAALKLAPARGSKFPLDERLTCHRASSVMDANGIQVITAEYVGIAVGTQTEVQVTGGFRSNQEPISTHPAFIKFGGRKGAEVNGASFSNDGSFKRFADPEYSEWHGVTSYLVPGFSINGHFYTKNPGALPALKDAMGTTSGTGSWAGFNLVGPIGVLAKTSLLSWNGVPDFVIDLTILRGADDNGVPRIEDIQRNQLLLTGVSVEYFGDLTKVSYDISYSQDGWNPAIYNGRNDIRPAKAAGTKWNGKGTLGLGAAFNALNDAAKNPLWSNGN
jgi:hypothetical protein